ncbi:MAG: class I SAM-dependent methyltransferase [Anaerolineae bacterium]|nr:class I SAM-dependent methyltransferase [Anaerolineae bacterium]
MKIDQDRIRAALEAEHSVWGSPDIPYRNDSRWQLGSPSDGSANDFIVRHLTPTDRVLDLGCGKGHVLTRLSASFHYGLGIDNDPRQIQRAKDAKREQGIQNVDFLLLDFPQEARRLQPESFDMVISIRGALYDTDESIQAAHRLLRPDGLLFAEEVGELHTREADEIFGGPPEFAEGISVLKNYREALQRNGFEVRLAADVWGKMFFPDIYTWAKYERNFGWFSVSLPDPDDPRIALYAERNTISTGEVVMTWHCPWIGCVKK